MNIRVWFKMYMDMQHIVSQMYLLQNELYITTMFTASPSLYKLSDKNHRRA